MLALLEDLTVTGLAEKVLFEQAIVRSEVDFCTITVPGVLV
jgi:hypothetical protein